MKEEEYKAQLKEIYERFEAEKKSLAKRYAFENAEFKEGDIITDGFKIIRVDRLQYSYSLNEFPGIVYTGVELKKDLQPKKKGEQASIYGYRRGIKKLTDKTIQNG